MRGCLSIRIALLVCWILSAHSAAHAVDNSFGFWNTNLEQLNVIECHNLSLKSRNAQITIYSANQEILGQAVLRFEGRSSRHVVVNPFTGPNHYGTYSVAGEETGGQSNTLKCHTAVYRSSDTASRGKAIEYAYVLPSAVPISGPSSGLFNSMDPAGSARAVYNWLTLFNSDSTPISGRIELFNLQGQPLANSTIHFTQVKPGERIDFALGHPLGQVIGLYRIIPDTASTYYAAFLVRYAPRQDGGFSFAIPLAATADRDGDFVNGCRSQPVYASTMDPALNWAEIVNTSEQSGSATLQIFDQSGQSKGMLPIHLEPHAQLHLRINDYLGARNIGLLRLNCAAGNSGKISIQSMYYGFSSDNRLEWAYAAQQTESEATLDSVVAHSVNTYLDAANWALYINYAQFSSGHDLRLLTSTGGIAAERSLFLPPSGTVAQDIHSTVGKNFVGLSFGRSLSENARYGTELLRAFPTTSGSIGYIMRVPSYKFPLTTTTAYFRVETDQQSFNIKLSDPTRIARARAILADPNRADRHVLGRVIPTASSGSDYNQPWSFNLDSESIEFFELSAEICDYPVARVESELRTSGQVNLPSQIWCPWTSKLVEELIY